MPRFLTILALILVTLASSLVWASSGSAAKPKPKQPPPRTAVIVLENHEYSQIIGSGEMPFLNGLVPQGTLVTEYSGVSHPSLPNYLAMIGGSTYGISSDCTECWASGSNLGVQLSEAGISWRAYMEDMPEPCYPGATSGGYAKKHNPFMYFESITTAPNLCQHVVPAGSWLEADLRSKRGLRTFTWITPNLCNDGHDCSLATTDSWLSGWVPWIIKKLGPEGILIITLDEGSPGLHVPALVVGPGARKGAQLSEPFNHYSLLATIESRYHLPRLNESTGAAPMKGAILKPRKKHVKH